MELVEAARMQLGDLLGHHGCGDDAPALEIVVEAVVHARQRAGPPRAAALRHAHHALEIRRRHEAGDDRYRYAFGGRVVAKPRDRVAVEAELPDGAARPRIDLALEQVEVVTEGRRIRMPLGIARDADLERSDAADTFDQFRRRGVTV